MVNVRFALIFHRRTRSDLRDWFHLSLRMARCAGSLAEPVFRRASALRLANRSNPLSIAADGPFGTHPGVGASFWPAPGVVQGQEPELIGAIDGSVADVAVRCDHVYITEGAYFIVLSAADARPPAAFGCPNSGAELRCPAGS